MAKAVALVLVSIGVALLLSEVTIRALDLFPEARSVSPREAGADPKQPGAYRRLFKTQLHPYRGWSFRPGTDIAEALALLADRHDDLAAPSEWELSLSRVNQFGFFSALDDYRDLQDEDFVVAIFGGSVAGALVTSAGPALVEALGARLPAHADRLVIVSLAAPAYKQPQQLIILMEMALLGVPLDVIVNFDGFNEVDSGGADARAGFHPYFPSRRQFALSVDLASGVPSDVAILGSAEVLRERAAERDLALWLRDSSLARISVVARTIAGALSLRHAARALVAEEALQRAEAESDLDDASAGLGDPCLGLAGDCYPLIAEIWANASLLMHSVAESMGAQYLHLLQPSQYVEGSKPLSDQERERAFAPKGPAALGVRRGYPHLLSRGAWLRERGVGFHDLTRLFEDRDETLYLDACCHYNAQGNRIAAEAIAQWIEDPAERSASIHESSD
jgi:hypothetical protein